MTGGTVVILGSVGDNFGAGMTGGMAFVYDENDAFLRKVNDESVVIQRVQTPYWERLLFEQVKAHAERTESPRGIELLNNWIHILPKFWQIIPKEMVARLEHPLVEQPVAVSR
jgi:glutamate synthase (NADPH) large chain